MSKVRIIPLGGVGEIGKNCTVVEQDNDLILIDCGLSFPNEEMPGVDIVIPDFTYVIENQDRLRGIFLTHAHEDHVGALPYLLKQVNAPVFASEFTLKLIQSKLEERMGPKNLKLNVFGFGTKIEVGSLTVEPIRVTHSIPENASFAVHTKHGAIIFTGDFKLDFSPVDGKLTQLSRFAQLGEEGVVCLLSDCTNVDRPGWGPSESIVSDGLRKVFSQATGRVLLTTFASNIHRMQQVFDVAYETGRRVAVVGRRMEQNVETCERMGHLKLKPGVRLNLDEVSQVPPESVAVLTTGSQGEPLSALVQMSKGEYGRFQIQRGDTLIYSARPIPGNEAAIWRTINRLFRMGATVIYDGPIPVHVSGHAYQEELKMMINLVKPFYVAPVHGEPRHQHKYLEMAAVMGYPEHRMFTMESGIPLEITETNAEMGDRVPCGRVLVDKAGNQGVSDDLLRDRNNLSRDGLVMITIAISPEREELVEDPVIQTRGFNGSEAFIERLKQIIIDALLHDSSHDYHDVDRLRHQITDLARRYIAKSLQLRPVVIPTIIEV